MCFFWKLKDLMSFGDFYALYPSYGLGFTHEQLHVFKMTNKPPWPNTLFGFVGVLLWKWINPPLHQTLPSEKSLEFFKKLFQNTPITKCSKVDY